MGVNESEKDVNSTETTGAPAAASDWGDRRVGGRLGVCRNRLYETWAIWVREGGKIAVRVVPLAPSE